MNFQKNVTAIILFFGVISLYAQQKEFSAPDYDLIKKEVKKRDYKEQLNRLKECDTTLTAMEYRNLYFGYFFQSGYNPYGRSPDAEKMQKYYQSEQLDEKDYPKIIEIANKCIRYDPFDLRTMNFLAYVYHLKGDELMMKKTSVIMNGIFGAILSSGDGKTCETGFHVISVSHEYFLLNMFELESKSQSLTGSCDYLSFEKGKYKIDGLYFNISKMMEKEMEALGK